MKEERNRGVIRPQGKERGNKRRAIRSGDTMKGKRRKGKKRSEGLLKLVRLHPEEKNGGGKVLEGMGGKLLMSKKRHEQANRG